jgi:tetratricopeptide (TPR) repeat protein
MPAAERRWLHGCIGVLLRERDAAPLETAQHFEAAGRDADAAPLFEAAAEDARRTSRPAEQAALLDRAVQCWQRAARPDRAFVAMNVRIAPLIWTAGSAQALALVRELLAAAVTPLQRAGALSELAHVLAYDGDHAGAIAPAREAVALVEAHPEFPADERLKCVQVLVNQLPYVGAADEALALLTRFMPLAEQEGGLRYQFILNAHSQVLHRLSRLGECAAVIQRSLDLIVAEENWREVVTVSGNLSIVLGNLGRYEDAWRAIERAGQALSRLEIEGLLDLKPRTGLVVSMLDDDAVDELGLVEMRHGGVAALELDPRQNVAGLELGEGPRLFENGHDFGTLRNPGGTASRQHSSAGL